MVAQWLSGASQYNNLYSNRNFFEDLIYIHDQLGLVAQEGKAFALAHIVSYEYLLILCYRLVIIT